MVEALGYICQSVEVLGLACLVVDLGAEIHASDLLETLVGHLVTLNVLQVSSCDADLQLPLQGTLRVDLVTHDRRLET